MTSVQPRQAIGGKARFSRRDETRVAAQLTHDRLARGPFIENRIESGARRTSPTAIVRLGAACSSIPAARLRSDSSFPCTYEQVNIHWFNRLGLHP